MTPAEILDRAADVIDERGHCKSMLEHESGAVCANGAIVYALAGPGWVKTTGWIDAFQKTTDLLAAKLQVVSVPDWNNAPERTKDEVTSTMRAVAATLRAKSAVEMVTA